MSGQQHSGVRRSARLVLGVAVVAAVAVTASGAQAATTGWGGEQLVSTTASGDGWEPSVAADPSAPYVYEAWMQYSGTKISISYRVSADGGASWGPAKPICPSCSTKQGQYDIVLATTATGTLDAVWMQGNHISFSRTSDHGATWTAPVQVSGSTWADKPWLAVSGNGNDIYVGWSSRGNVSITASHNAGAAWSTPAQVTNENGIYYYPNGGVVLPNGTAMLAMSEYPENGNNTKLTGPVPIVVLRSTTNGSTWSRVLIDTLNTGATYATSSVTTITGDSAGNAVAVYSGSTSVGANGRVFARRSTDSGATWGAAVDLTSSAGGADATSVAAGARGTLIAATWMDKRGGAWNVWERQSTDGGATWTADVKVSDATSGASYKTTSGFGMPYGDYDAVAVTSAGKVVAVMGEGDTTQTHGDIWTNRQT
ncbi:MAG TPA: sialidase family protein [Candidatus Nanopelagicales bacterium]|nr:sialidase family protein [Candidatus Nanopelagicales bacterium]